MPPSPLFGREALVASVVEHLRDQRPVVLSGQAGVGKSHLARATAGAMRARGVRVVEARGEGIAREIPLGAFAFLIRPETGPDSNFASAMWNLQLSLLGGDGHDVLLLVDDAHLLDPLSLALVGRVAGTSQACLLLTAREGEDMPPSLVEFWSQGNVEHVVVPALDRAGLLEMVGELLGADLSSATAEEFWRLSQGNPLCARELVIEAREQKRISIVEGVARHDGRLSLGGRANELIEARLAGLPDPTVRALRLIAAVGSLSRGDLEEIVGGDVIDDLDARGLIDLWRDERRRRVSPRHPLYGELMGESMGEHELREAAGLLFDAAAERPERRVGDALASAELGVRAGRDVPTTTLDVAAHEALVRYSPVQAERFSREVIARGNAVADTRAVLANALVLQGRLDEAAEVFTLLMESAATDEERARAAVARAAMTAFALKDFDGALDLLAAIGEEIAEQSARDMLAAQQGILSVFARGCDPALEAVQPVVARGEKADSEALFLAYSTQIVGAALSGQLALADSAGTAVGSLVAGGAFPRIPQAAAAVMLRGWSIFHGGSAADSLAYLTAIRHDLSGVQATVDVAIGINHSLSGLHRESQTVLDRAMAGLVPMLDPMGQMAWTEAIQIENAVMLGDGARAERFRSRLLARSAAERLQFGPDIARCLAIYEVGFGEHAVAEDIFDDALALARDLGQWTFSVKVLMSWPASVGR